MPKTLPNIGPLSLMSYGEAQNVAAAAAADLAQEKAALSAKYTAATSATPETSDPNRIIRTSNALGRNGVAIAQHNQNIGEMHADSARYLSRGGKRTKKRTRIRKNKKSRRKTRRRLHR